MERRRLEYVNKQSAACLHACLTLSIPQPAPISATRWSSSDIAAKYSCPSFLRINRMGDHHTQVIPPNITDLRKFSMYICTSMLHTHPDRNHPQES